MGTIMGRICSEGFRVFFLFAAIFGAGAGLVWALWLGTQIAGDGIELVGVGVAPQQWHAHEMIFGYATAALGGFFLTAVPNWTNAPAARTSYIGAAAGIWLAGRIAIWLTGVLPAGLVMVIDLAFLPFLAAKVLTQLLKRPKPQNMVFLAFIAALWVADLMVHLGWMEIAGNGIDTGLRMGLVALCALIAVLGGRITPAFTRNAMKRAGAPEHSWPVSRGWADKATMLAAVALPWLVLALGADSTALGLFALAFAALQLLRLSGWRGAWTIRQPILLALHAGIGFLALGMALWGLAALGIGAELAALHVLGIGCVGTMTIAVMSRATLGHTGRALIAPRPVAIGYGLVVAAAFTRWLGAPLTGDAYLVAMLAAATFWSLAFGLFLVALAAPLTQPRPARPAA